MVPLLAGSLTLLAMFNIWALRRNRQFHRQMVQARKDLQQQHRRLQRNLYKFHLILDNLEQLMDIPNSELQIYLEHTDDLIQELEKMANDRGES